MSSNTLELSAVFFIVNTQDKEERGAVAWFEITESVYLKTRVHLSC